MALAFERKQWNKYTDLRAQKKTPRMRVIKVGEAFNRPSIDHHMTTLILRVGLLYGRPLSSLKRSSVVSWLPCNTIDFPIEISWIYTTPPRKNNLESDRIWYYSASRKISRIPSAEPTVAESITIVSTKIGAQCTLSKWLHITLDINSNVDISKCILPGTGCIYNFWWY